MLGEILLQNQTTSPVTEHLLHFRDDLVDSLENQLLFSMPSVHTSTCEKNRLHCFPFCAPLAYHLKFDSTSVILTFHPVTPNYFWFLKFKYTRSRYWSDAP